MDLTRYEIKVINMLFDSIFTIEKKKQLLLESDSSLYIDFAINGESAEKIYTLFDNAFELEHKIEIIFALYRKQGFDFKDIHELLDNRNVLIFNYYDILFHYFRTDHPNIRDNVFLGSADLCFRWNAHMQKTWTAQIRDRLFGRVYGCWRADRLKALIYIGYPADDH